MSFDIYHISLLVGRGGGGKHGYKSRAQGKACKAPWKQLSSYIHMYVNNCT